MKLYEPQPSDPRVVSVVIEEDDGQRYLVSAAGLIDTTKAYGLKTPYRGAVRKDPVRSTLRGIAWSLGVPDAMTLECPGD